MENPFKNNTLASGLLGFIMGMGTLAGVQALMSYSDSCSSGKTPTVEILHPGPADEEFDDVKTALDYHGIDVSNHQGEIDWPLVAKDNNIKFVYIKATEGATHQDKRYKENINGARKNGFPVGSYHYLRNTSYILNQFDNFISVVDKDMQDLIPMVDVEEKVEKDSILLFCNLIKSHYGKSPIIYGTNKSYNSYCAPDFNNYYLMIGRYGNNPPEIKGKGHYNIWQFSEKGKINGISKPVDLNKFHPDFELSKLKL